MVEPVPPPASSSARYAVSHRRQRAVGEAPRLHQPRRPTGLTADLAAVAHEAAVRTRRTQGLPDHVTDPAVLAHVADLLATAEAAEHGRQRSGVPP